MVFLFLFLFAGCAKIPPYSSAAIPPPQSLQNSVTAALDTDTFKEGSWPKETWWELFQDPQLSQLIEEGLKNNPDIKKTEAKIQESLGIAKQIKARLFPHINFFGQDNWEHLSAHGFEREFAFHQPPPNQIPPALAGTNFSVFATPVPAVLQVLDIGFDMNWQLDFFEKNRFRLAAALGEAKAVEAEAKKNRLLISSQIATTYFSLQTQWAILAVYKELITLRKKLNALTEQRTQTGLGSALDTLLTQIDVSQAEKLIIDLEETAELDRHRLLVLIGQNPDTGREIEPHFSALESPLPIPEEISSNLLARRPDLMAAIWNVEKAACTVGVAKREFYPEINLKGLLSLRSVVPSQLFNISSTANSLFPSFTLPVFRGGELRGNLKEKLALFDEAANTYHDTLLKALQEVADVLVQLETTSRKIDAQKAICQESEERAALMHKQFDTGTASYLSFLQFELESINQKSTLLSFQSDKILFAIKLMQALGGGYQSPYALPKCFTQEGSNGS